MTAIVPQRSNVASAPIVLTGLHRSGTTFAGRVLSAPRGMGYIPEPFSYRHGLVEIDHWYLYLKKGMVGEERYVAMVRRLLSGRALYKRPNGNEPTAVGWRRLGRKLRYLVRSRAQVEYWQSFLNPFVRRLLIKDPFAALASEYLHREFGLQVIVLLRHPAAFVASIKRATSLHWRPFDFREFLLQKDLMEDHLGPILATRSLENLSTIEAAALQWVCVTHVLATYLDRNERMICVRHEDLSLSPRESFGKLLAELDIAWDARIETVIHELTSAENPVEAEAGRIHSLRRNSAAAVRRWRQYLTSEEVGAVREIAGEVASRFYGDDEW